MSNQSLEQNKYEAHWEKMFAYAKQYYLEHGHLKVPHKYQTADGYTLGNWVHTQRGVHKGSINRKRPTLNPERIARLEEIGMVWGDIKDIDWQRNYKAAKAYYKKHGNLNIPRYYVTPEGIKLGIWLLTQRTYKNGTVKNDSLTPERISKLEKIGMVWDVPDNRLEQHFIAAEEFYKENGHLNVDRNYCTENGLELGAWIERRRKIKAGKIVGQSLSEEEIARLDAIGMIWDMRNFTWEEYFAAAEAYYHRNGHLNVSVRYHDPYSGLRLGAWLSRLRSARAGTCAGVPPTEEQIARLNSIGMIWEGLKNTKRNRGYQVAPTDGENPSKHSYTREDREKGAYLLNMQKTWKK